MLQKSDGLYIFHVTKWLSKVDDIIFENVFLAPLSLAAVRRLSLVVVSDACPLTVVLGPLTAVWWLLAVKLRLHVHGLSTCSSWVQWLGYTGLVALHPVGSSWTRNQTHVLVLAGGFLTTGPPGKLLLPSFLKHFLTWLH